MPGIVKVDRIQNSSGQDLLVQGIPRRPGRIMEYLICNGDGSSHLGNASDISVAEINNYRQAIYSYEIIPGSDVAYCPPAGATKVVYKFRYGMRWEGAHAISHIKFFIDSDEVVFARHSRSALYPEDNSEFMWTMAIGGTTNFNTGRVSEWKAPKTLSMWWRAYGGSNARSMHATNYYDGTTNLLRVVPTLTIIAIA
jgi:hypothetical protein